MSRAGRGVAAAAALLALVPGCTRPEPVAPRPPAPVEDVVWPGCEGTGAFIDPTFEGDAPRPTGGVPEGFVPVKVVLCEQERRSDARRGEVVVSLERTSTELGSLLAYLAQADEPPSDGPCTADLWVPPWLVLVDEDGRFLFPAIPVDGCSKPLGGRDALPWRALPYVDRVVGVTPTT